MFYVTGAKIYLATFDAELKAYPEVKLVRDEADALCIVKTGKGIAKRPAGGRLCSLTEIRARFGALAQPQAPAMTSEPPKGSDET